MTLRLVSADPPADDTFDEKMHRLSLKLADDAIGADPNFRLDAFKVLGNYQVQRQRIKAPPPESDDEGFSFDAAKKRLTGMGETDDQNA